MIKKCLIIDNEDQTEEIEKLVRDAKNQGIKLECEQFNIGSPAYSNVLTNSKIDIEKVVLEYRRIFSGKTFHLIACDWDLEDDINGTELLRQLKHHRIFKHNPKIIYSGLMDNIIRDIIENNTVDKAIVKVKAIVKNGVIDYLERDNRDTEIINFFLSNEDSTDIIIEEELKKFPDLVFKNSFASNSFKGKTYAELSKLIEEDDILKNKFKREITQQVIAYLTEKI